MYIRGAPDRSDVTPNKASRFGVAAVKVESDRHKLHSDLWR